MIPFKLIEFPKGKWEHLNNGNSNADVLRVFQCDRFLIQIRRHGPTIRLCVNKVKFYRDAKDPGELKWQDGITWDELQEIKNQCGYQDHWMCEYYPPQDQVVNVANIRHLWLMDKPPEYTLKDKL